jgi:hypothetical protein
MPRQHVVVDTIVALDPKPVPPAAAGGAPPSGLVSLTLLGGGKAALDMAQPRSAVWRKVLESLHKTRQPAYLELDPATGVITELLLPRAFEVVAIRTAAAGDVEVELSISAARHYLRRGNPEFQALLGELQQAQTSRSPVLVTETLDGREIVDVRPLPKAQAVPQAQPTPSVPAPQAPPAPISLQRAKELFDLVANLTCDPASTSSPCIPFMFPDDGCWGRAHEMCRLMLAQSEQPQKVWIYGWLHVATSNHPSCGVNWGWHVAPTLIVDEGSGPETYVMDPSIFSEPVPQATWASVQGDPGASLQPSDASVFRRSSGGAWVEYDADYSKTNAVLESYRNALRLRSAAYGAPPYSACRADPYVRDNLQDGGVEPLASGGISASPDINHFIQPLDNPLATLGTPAAKAADDLSEPIEFGQPNYIYVRLQNRGSAAAAVDVDVYYSLPSTLPTPSSWTLIGSLTTRPIVPGEFYVAGPLVWSLVPQPGHYCFVAVLGNAADPKPDLASIHTVDQFYALIRERNNVTWKNFDVRDVVPGSTQELAFSIQGWPRVAYRGDLEVDVAALPARCQVRLRMLRRLTNGTTAVGMTRSDETEEHVLFDVASGRVAALRGMPLRASDHSHAKLAIHFPSGVPEGAYQVSVLQKVGEKEMGRVSQRLVVGAYPYVANANTYELHAANCEWVQRISPSHRRAFRDARAAFQRGYDGCRFCLAQFDHG